MSYLKNREISIKYNISYPTVIKWIEDSENKKNNIQVSTFNKKLKVIDNLHNHAELSRLSNESKKFRSSISLKKVEVTQKFYDLFSPEQIIDIFNDLDSKKEIKIKYSYKDGGANLWDEYYWGGVSPLKTANHQLIKNSFEDILYFVSKSKKINIIDIGPGNGHPVKELMESLGEIKLLNRYIPIDISKEILDITKRNVREWFASVSIKDYEADIEISRFSRIFLENSSISNSVSNLILHIGNTMSNHDDRIQVLKNLRSGMIKDDLIIISFTLDTLENKSSLNYVKNAEADLQDTWPLGELGIDLDKCELKVFFNEKIGAKVKTITLDKDYVIQCKLFGEFREIELSSGQELVIWKHYLISEEKFMEEIKESDLKLLDLKLDSTLNNALVVCKVR
jgi:hypothetical protein